MTVATWQGAGDQYSALLVAMGRDKLETKTHEKETMNANEEQMGSLRMGTGNVVYYGGQFWWLRKGKTVVCVSACVRACVCVCLSKLQFITLTFFITVAKRWD